MLETSVLLGNVGASGGGGGGGAAVAVSLNEEERVSEALDSGSIGEDKIGGLEEADRNLSGNRWPREETLALLGIRSDMDASFRDSTLKAPLWDEVSRKLAKLGYHRNAKKCKEKFENIYKYHKRTKDGRSGRQTGKNYRFFEQLEVFESHPSLSLNKIGASTTETTTAMPAVMATPVAAVKSAGVTQDGTPTCSTQNTTSEFMSASTSTTSSSGKESGGNFKKRRKLAHYFGNLMKQVLEKQEDLQNKFLEAIEKCERDRTAREEAWKMQEMARIKKEREMLAQERAVAAAKDAAVIAFLQKISDQTVPVQVAENPTPPSEGPVEKQENSTISDNNIQASSSRWPKAEVEALIQIRSNLDLQHQDSGLKGSLWEEISSAMKNLGYDRNAKRCKEKWENINKYYRRVKESNKRRAEDSKTCPYFHMLESLYEKKLKKINSSVSSACFLKPEDILLQMMGQEPQQQPQQQQLQPKLQPQQQEQQSVTEEGEDSDNNAGQNLEEEVDDDKDDNANNYHIAVNNPSTAATLME